MMRPSSVPSLEAAVADLESYLGDPRDPAAAMSTCEVLALDESESYPDRMVHRLLGWGIQDWVIPAAVGGKAVDADDGFTLLRNVARRDPTTATALMISSVSSMSVWAGGTPEQQALLARELLDGTLMAWALSERDHGSDLMACEVTAVPDGDDYVLDGEKWLIGNCTKADLVAVFARTRVDGGPAGFSLFVVDKRRLVPGAYEHLDSEPLHGLRGLDLSGIRFTGCRVPADSLVGRVGSGLEMVLKGSQMVRATISSLTLGCADTALRETVTFARDRVLFGSRVFDIPYSRRQLVECFADLLVADALAIGSVRGIQVLPDQSSIISACVKYLLPTLLGETVEQLAVVLGSRHYLRSGRHALFQKMRRDLPVGNFADGNTVVNLKSVIAQLPALLDQAVAADEATGAGAAAGIGLTFGLSPDLPPFDPARHKMFGRGRNDLILALRDTVQRLADRAETAGDTEVLVWRKVLKAADEITAALPELRDDLLAERDGLRWGASAAAHTMAKRYSHLVAAAACLHSYAHGWDRLHPAVRTPVVLLAMLERVRHRSRPCENLLGIAEVDAAAEALLHLHSEHRMFSLRAHQLAEGLVS